MKESQPAEKSSAEPEPRRPSNDQRAGATMPSKRVAAAPRVDFEEIEVGDRAKNDLFIFNTADAPAQLTVVLEGSQVFQIEHLPTHLTPSSKGFRPDEAIKLVYTPQARGVDTAVVAALLRWPDGSLEAVRIPIRAAAHKRDELSIKETIEEEDAAARASAEQREQQRQADDMQKRNDAEMAKDRPWRGRIQDESERLAIDIENLFSSQKVGALMAKDKVAEYRRRNPPPAPPSLVSELVGLAIELASAGIAHRVGHMIEAMSHDLGVGMFATAVQDLLKRGGEGAAHQIEHGGSHAGESGGNASAAEQSETRIDYFGEQEEILADRVTQAKHKAINTKESLASMNNPAQAANAVAILKTAQQAVQAQKANARLLQEQESTKGWIRLVSHSTLGAVTADKANDSGLKRAADGASTAKIDDAVASKPYDGVIELEFHADLIRPSAPIRVTSAKLFGVSHESADVLRLASQPLRTSRLPIRARSTKESSPVDVSIARDEAGNVRYIDESGAVGMPTPWLAQRGGDAKSSVAAKRAATKLIEQLASSSLHQLGVNLETDDE